MILPKSALFLIGLAVVLICVPLNEAQETNLIVGGVNAAPGEIPYQVSLQYKKKHNCGGSILNKCWILTATHCVVGFRLSSLSILAGTTKLNTGGVRVGIKKSIPHYKYNRTIAYDIALIKLKKCLKFNKNIQAVELKTFFIPANVSGVVSGWGYINQNGTVPTNDLQKLKVKTISNVDCGKIFRNINSGNLCALNKEGEGFCQGDSGGPLVEEITKAQIGLVSANVPCARGYPDIYTRIATYVNWIRSTIKRNYYR